MPSAAIDRLLTRLQGVRPTGDSKWFARCPAHKDGTQSLSIKEGADGRALVYCFAGCTAGEIIAAVGLTLRDLFNDDGTRPKTRRQ
jgi:hypothetical protein